MLFLCVFRGPVVLHAVGLFIGDKYSFDSVRLLLRSSALKGIHTDDTAGLSQPISLLNLAP